MEFAICITFPDHWVLILKIISGSLYTTTVMLLYFGLLKLEYTATLYLAVSLPWAYFLFTQKTNRQGWNLLLRIAGVVILLDSSIHTLLEHQILSISEKIPLSQYGAVPGAFLEMLAFSFLDPSTLKKRKGI